VSAGDCAVYRRCRTWTVDPSSDVYYRWLAVISLAAMYNLTLIVGRTVLPDLQDKYRSVWISLDYACDLIYILDIVVRFRTSKLRLIQLINILYITCLLCIAQNLAVFSQPYY